MSRIPILGYTQHYNTKNNRHDDQSWRLGAFVIATPMVGINCDVWLGHNIFAFWWHPTIKYGRGR
jgi:hypothetical protein